MALAYHVSPNGTYISVEVNPPSASLTLTVLGVPEDGFLVEVTRHEKQVMTDVAGPEQPADIQDMGTTARVTGTLIAYDLTQAYLMEEAAGQVTQGLLPATGTLIGTGGYYTRVKITGQNPDERWYFPTCKVRNFSRKPSSQYNKYQLELFAWGFIAASVTTAATTIVYSNPGS